MTTGNLISLCMIVKNEEKFLDNCLSSVKNVADEIIIVDTGSTDRTVEIAESHGARIYHHPWEDNFSKHRNQSISYATGDWILIMDADEELVQEDVPKVLEAARDKEVDAIMFQVMSRLKGEKSQSSHNSERLLKNNGIIHYEGRVHNRPTGINKAKVYPIRLIHYGYDAKEVDLKAKMERTIALLKLDLEENPDNPITHHYLACAYLGKQMYQEALEESLAAIRLAEAQNDENMIYFWSRYNAAMCCYIMKDLDKAEAIALSALKRSSMHIDSHLILIKIYFEKKEWEKLIKHSNEYIRLIKLLQKTPVDFGSMVTSSVQEEWNVHIIRGIAYYETEQFELSEEAFQSAVQSAPDTLKALRAAGVYFHKKNCNHKAHHYLKKAHQLDPENEEVKKLLEQTGNMETISCCMIVKNEEAFLEQCLESVKDYVDEIIIVDTGSTDGTVEIARKYTDKLYFHPWENDFSKARNQSIQYATGDWIFIIDADEEIILEGNEDILHHAVDNAGKADGIFANVINVFSNSQKEARLNSLRLFRNNGIIHYEGIVHNRLTGFTSTRSSKLRIKHYGYNLDEKKANEKFIRTTNLLKKQIEENPADPLPHHYLASSYLSYNMIEKAAEESSLAIELADQSGETETIYIWTHYIAAISSFLMGNLAKAENYSLKALAKEPEHLDSYYVMTMIAAERHDWNNIFNYGNKYLNTLESFQKNPDRAGLVVNNMMKEEWIICLLMGHASHALKKPYLVHEFYQKSLDSTEEKWKIYWKIGTFYLDEFENLDLAHKYLSLALKESPENPDIWYMLAKLNNKVRSFDEEKKWLEQLFKHGNEDLVVLNRLADLCIERGELDQALAASRRGKEKYPEDPQILSNLGLIYKKLKKPHEAAENYMKLAELQPESAEAWHNLGLIAMEFNRLDEARDFLERAASLQCNYLNALLKLCEIDLRQNRIEKFILRCDSILRQLDLNRDRVINSFEDLADILLEIGFELRNDQEAASQSFNLLPLLPVDFDNFLHKRIKIFLEDKNAERAVYMLKAIQKLSKVQ